MHKQGYTEVRGSDISQNLADWCKSTGWYKETECRWLGKGEFPEDQREAYDVVTTAGTLCKGHIPKEGLDDLIGFVKVGGYFITAFRLYYFVNGHECGYKDKLDEFVAAGKLELYHTYEFERGFSKEGVSETILEEFKDAINRFQMGKSILTIYKKTA